MTAPPAFGDPTRDRAVRYAAVIREALARVATACNRPPVRERNLAVEIVAVTEDAQGVVDFDTILDEARRNHVALSAVLRSSGGSGRRRCSVRRNAAIGFGIGGGMPRIARGGRFGRGRTTRPIGRRCLRRRRRGGGRFRRRSRARARSVVGCSRGASAWCAARGAGTPATGGCTLRRMRPRNAGRLLGDGKARSDFDDVEVAAPTKVPEPQPQDRTIRPQPCSGCSRTQRRQVARRS